MSGHVPIELRRRVREQFFNACAYCRTRESLTVATFEVEHIIPRMAGGETIPDNLCLACPTCNRCKANRMTAIDPLTTNEVSLFHPHHDAWSDHFAWSDDGAEIIGLSAVGRATLVALRMNRLQLVRLRRMWLALNEHPRNDR